MLNKIFAILLLVLFGFLASAEAQIKIAFVYGQTGKETDFYCVSKAYSDHLDPKIFKTKFFDSQNNVAQTLVIAKQIIEEKFDVVVGTRTSQEALVAAPLFEQAQIPFIVPISSHDDITKNRKLIIRMVSPSSRYARLYAGLMAHEFRVKTVAAIEDTSTPYSQFYVENTLSALKKANPSIQIKIHKIFQSYPDYDKLIQQIKTDAPDLIYMPIYTAEALSFIKAAEVLTKKTILLSHASINDSRNFARNPEMIKNPNLTVYFDGIWNGKLSGPEANEYRKTMAECKGYQDSLRSVAAFDAAKLVTSVVSKYPTLRQEPLVTKILAASFTGIIGDRKRQNREPQLPLNLFVMTSREFKFYKKYDGSK